MLNSKLLIVQFLIGFEKAPAINSTNQMQKTKPIAIGSYASSRTLCRGLPALHVSACPRSCSRGLVELKAHSNTIIIYRIIPRLLNYTFLNCWSAFRDALYSGSIPSSARASSTGCTWLSRITWRINGWSWRFCWPGIIMCSPWSGITGRSENTSSVRLLYCDNIIILQNKMRNSVKMMRKEVLLLNNFWDEFNLLFPLDCF